MEGIPLKTLFSIDNPLVASMNKLADLMIVNLLTLLCCIPIITIGASYTAMYRVLLKLYKGESAHIVREFFDAFRENFRNATILWLIYLLFGIAIFVDFLLMRQVIISFNAILTLLLYGIIAILLISAVWCFALESRYKNSIVTTMLNSFVVGLTHLGKTIVIGVLTAVPFLAMILYLPLTLIVVLFGVALAGYLQIIIFNKVFMEIESNIEKNADPNGSNLESIES